MGNNIGSAVNKGITRTQFQISLQNDGVKGKKLDNAMAIFDTYAAMNTEATGEDASRILDEKEQVMARDAFAQWNKDDDNNVGRREYKNGNQTGTGFEGASYGDATAYMRAMEHAASHSGNGIAVGEMTVTENGAVVTYGAETPEDSDDAVTIYTRGNNGAYSSSNDLQGVAWDEPEETVPEAEEEAPVPEAPEPPTFESEQKLRDTVVRYLLGMGEDEAVDAGINFGDNFEYSVNDGVATVKFNGKEYTARTNSDGKLVFENDEEQSTLQQAVLNSESTDDVNHYHNRGRKGNLRSTYSAETGVITNNSGTGRQGVSQVQTLSSMIMNNNESSTLKLDGQLQENNTRVTLNGAGIIESIDTNDGDSRGKITKSELIKFLNAAVNEAKATVQAASPGTPGGSRIYAPNVDLDLKDLANIGIVFDKYAGEDKMLDASELGNLLNDLKNGKSMSQLAGTTGTYEYVGPAETPEVEEAPIQQPIEDVPFAMQFGDVATVDRTRDNSEGGSVTYTYSGGANGTRSMVADDGTGTTRLVTNANVAEYDDHGLFNMGKKEFLVIQGLEQNVRAEVVSGTLHSPMTISVKDASGNETFKRVTYDTNTRTYSLGDVVYKNKNGQYRTAKERTRDGLQALFGRNSDLPNKLPTGMSIEYDNNGEIVYKFRGSKITPKVARVMIMNVNVPASSE